MSEGGEFSKLSSVKKCPICGGELVNACMQRYPDEKKDGAIYRHVKLS